MRQWLGLVLLALPLSAPAAGHAEDLSQLRPTATPATTTEEDLRCLTLAVAYEAGNQSQAGQEAVAEVVLNRTRHPAFPRNVCDVVFQGWTRGSGCQFTFACDGAIDRRLPQRILAGARSVAERVAAGSAPARVAGALNYHADYVNPTWAARLDRVARIGAHIFYRPPPGQLPEGARTDQPVADRTNEGSLAIRRYARYFVEGERLASAAGGVGPASEPAAGVAAHAALRSGNETFLPWGLALR